MSRAQSEKDLCFWYMQRDAKLGVSAVGFEGSGGPAIWDDARIARAHGIAIDEVNGSVELLHTGRLSPWHRDSVDRAARIAEVMAIVPPETKKLLRASYAMVGAAHFVANFFDSGSLAPLVGLALLLWYEEKRDETRSPAALLESWDASLKSPDDVEDDDGPKREEKKKRQVQINAQAKKLLAPLRGKTIELYDVVIGVYDSCAAHVARERKNAPNAEILAERRAVREAEMAALRRRGNR